MALDRPLVSIATLCICGAAIGAIRDGPTGIIDSNRKSRRRCHAYSWITVRPFTGLRRVSTISGATYPAQDESCCGLRGGGAQPSIHSHANIQGDRLPPPDLVKLLIRRTEIYFGI